MLCTIAALDANGLPVPAYFDDFSVSLAGGGKLAVPLISGASTTFAVQVSHSADASLTLSVGLRRQAAPAVVTAPAITVRAALAAALLNMTCSTDSSLIGAPVACQVFSWAASGAPQPITSDLLSVAPGAGVFNLTGNIDVGVGTRFAFFFVWPQSQVWRRRLQHGAA